MLCLRNALRCAARGPAAQGRSVCFAYPAFRFAQSGINPRPTHFLKQRKRAFGNVAGYYRSSLAGLGYCGRELVVFLDKVRRGDPTPGASPGVSFFVAQGRRETGARRAFARRACTTLRAPLRCARFSTPPREKRARRGPRACGARKGRLF
jgi:hypothetical protein